MKSGIAVLALGLSLMGCANEQTGVARSFSMAYLGASPVDAANAADFDGDADPATKKTVASKVLSAMAFERVTGFKADPARLLETE